MPCSRYSAANCASKIKFPSKSVSPAAANRTGRNSSPGCTSSQLGAEVRSSMNAVACAYLEGGLNI